jgi:hypothetical protein
MKRKRRRRRGKKGRRKREKNRGESFKFVVRKFILIGSLGKKAKWYRNVDPSKTHNGGKTRDKDSVKDKYTGCARFNLI